MQYIPEPRSRLLHFLATVCALCAKSHTNACNLQGPSEGEVRPKSRRQSRVHTPYAVRRPPAGT